MTYQLEQRSLGPLDCTIVDASGADDRVELAVILCHGFGAPGTDLVGLGPEFVEQLGEDARHIRFYFPQAPLSLASAGMPSGRAWWMLDLEQLQLAAQGLITRDQRSLTPDGLVEARSALSSCLEAIKQETGLDESRIVLGGFSQGSMIATDLALRLETPPAGLVIWSGTLLCESDWTSRATQRGPLTVIQFHGTNDPILPFGAAEDLHDLLKGAGCAAEFHSFPGPHTIPLEGIDRTVSLLRELRKNH